jgi:hypothetical protein
MTEYLLHYLMNSRELHARQDWSGALVLEYGRVWRRFGIVLGAAWIAIFAFLFIDSPPKPDDVPVALGMIASVAVAMTALLTHIYRLSITLTSSGIHKRSACRRDVFASWGQVERLTYNPVLKQFVIQTAAGRICVPRTVDGLATLRDEIERRVPSPRWSPVKRELDSAARLA